MITKTIFNFCFVAIFILVAYSCSKDTDISGVNTKSINIVKNDNSELEIIFRKGDFILAFQSSGQNSINSSVKISSLNSALQTNFSINEKSNSYKLIQHKRVLSEANRLLNMVSKEEIIEISLIFEELGKSLINDSRINSSSSLFESFFFHNAIINSIKRSKINGQDCGCTPHPGYFVDKANFWCQEDYLINPKKYLEGIIKSNYKPNSTEIIVVDFLKSVENHEFISIDKLFEVIETKSAFLERIDYVYSSEMKKIARTSDDEDDDILRKPCLKGNQWGCCGNYSGCCWYKSIICLAHDYYCQTCTPRWFCLPGCVPG